MENTPITCSIILAVFGQYRKVEPLLAASIAMLQGLSNSVDLELVIVFDRKNWLASPFVNSIPARFAEGRVVLSWVDKPDLPAALYNQGIALSKGLMIYCTLPGCSIDVEPLVEVINKLAPQSYYLWAAYIEKDQFYKLTVPEQMIMEDFLYYFMSSARLFRLSDIIFKREAFETGLRFPESPVLQKQFDVAFYKKLAFNKVKLLVTIGSMVKKEVELSRFPFERDFRIPEYDAQAFRIREGDQSVSVDISDEFLVDFPALARENNQHPANPPAVARPVGKNPFKRPIKVVITGGVWEYHHNRLYFYNYFHALAGQGMFSYTSLLDMLVEPERDLCGVDIVIISRGRHPNVLRIVEYCKKNNIPMIYMIDDNWIVIAKDWPDPYAKIFAPGLPSYEIFLTCLKECDLTYLCNSLLEEDIRPYAREIVRLPINITEKDFQRPLEHQLLNSQIADLQTWRDVTGGLLIGYAGTIRYNADTAFKVLADICKEYPARAQLFMFGMVTKEQSELFDSNVRFLPFVPYEDYTAAMGKLRPDIMVAPLHPSRTNMSKIPTKYLDYAMIGAAGVYAKMTPYTEYIQDGVNGLLVENYDEQGWRDAITRLINDDDLRNSIRAAARQDVLAHYETSVVAPQFVDMLYKALTIRGVA